MRRLTELADSVRSAIEYAQENVRLLETKDATLGLRLDEADRNVATVLRADVLQRSRLDALERQDRIRSLAFEALSRRAQSQEAYTREVGAAVVSLREARGKLDGALAALERQQAASTSAYAQLGRNVESLSGWAEGFRRAGLSSNTVQEKFAFLSDELRRIRIRVDSLRPLPRNVTASDPR